MEVNGGFHGEHGEHEQYGHMETTMGVSGNDKQKPSIPIKG
jgi:hypothetical protein